MQLKIKLKNYFTYFHFFYDYLGYKVFIGILLSFLVGLFDGLGLVFFIPLIQLSVGGNSSSEMELDKFSNYLVEYCSFDLNLLNVFYLIAILFSLKGIFKFIDIYYRVWLEQMFMRDIRDKNISLLGKYDYQHFTLADTGRIQNIMSTEVNRVKQAYKQYFKTLHYFILVIVYILLALVSSWLFSILALTGGILMNLIFSLFYKRTKYFSRKYSEEGNKFQGLLMQKINNFHYLKATGTLKSFEQKLKLRTRELEKYQLKLGVFEAILNGIKEPISIVIIFTAIFIFTNLLGNPINGILLSLLLLYRSITFYMGMQEQWNAFLGNAGSLDNLKSFTQELIDNTEKTGDTFFTTFRKDLALNNASFAYINGINILANIDLTIKKNETVAIVGESGAGKSTLMNILAGILKVTNGTYKVDGNLIDTLDIISFKNKLGYIVQDPVIFNDTIFNNISFWDQKTEVNLEKMNRSARKAAILSFIESQDGKEDTLLGFNGINISSGQKQRLSIARELYKEVDILFMDEATSNLDSETESEIQTNIAKLKGHYTIIIIAHRLATVKLADRIVVLSNGKIDDIGSYNELLKKNKEFRRMVKLQEL